MAIQSHKILSRNQYYIDTRTTLTRFIDFFRVRFNVNLTLFIMLIALLVVPERSVIFLTILIPILALIYRYAPVNAPLYLHKSTKIIDEKFITPDGSKGKAAGVFYLGMCLETKRPVFDMIETFLRHVFVAGVTGAGKTEQLVSLMCNYFLLGSGGIYSDAKGTSKLFFSIFTILRYLGREDDLFLLNYNSVADDNAPLAGGAELRFTNTCAPFNASSFSRHEITQTLLSLIQPEGSSNAGGNAVFSQAAESLVKVVVDALYEKARKNIITLSPKLIRDSLDWNSCSELVFDKAISPQTRDNVLSFFKTRSGFDVTKDFNDQDDQTKQQYGYAQAYTARILQMLSDTYSHIYRHGRGEVNVGDIVLNNRVLVVILPSMELSPSELANLAGINMTLMRSALALGLGVEVDGFTSDLLSALPTNSAVPNAIILDEFTYQKVKNYAITVAQARSMNSTMIISSQDWAGIVGNNDPESGQLWSNTRNKFFMGSELDDHTKKMLDLVIPEVYVAKLDGYRVQGDKMYMGDTRSYEKVKLYSTDDLREMNTGVAILFQRHMSVKMKTFYHGFHESKFIKRATIWDGIEPHFNPISNPLYEILKPETGWQLRPILVWARNFKSNELSKDAVPERNQISSMRSLTVDNPNFGLKGMEAGFAQIVAHANAPMIRSKIDNAKMLAKAGIIPTTRNHDSSVNQHDRATPAPVTDKGTFTVSPAISSLISGDNLNSIDAIPDTTPDTDSNKDNKAFNTIDLESMIDLAVTADTAKENTPLAPKAVSIKEIIEASTAGNIEFGEFSVEQPEKAGVHEYQVSDEIDPASDSDVDPYDHDDYTHTAISVITSENRERIRLNTIEVEKLLGGTTEEALAQAESVTKAIDEETKYTKVKVPKCKNINSVTAVLEAMIQEIQNNQ